MLWIRRFWLKVGNPFRRKRNAEQLDDEIQFHLDEQVRSELS